MRLTLKLAINIFAFSCFATQPVFAQSMDYLGLRGVFGEPVTTSANGSPQKESDVPLNMEIITQDDIQKSGARSLQEVLRFIPGFTVRESSFGQTEVSIRGYNQPNSERILVLVDGRQVYTDFFGQVTWDNIAVELADIQQIEVVKGPNTALFGFNAVSGVVNIITNNPLYNEMGTVTTRVGTQGLTEVSAVKSMKIHDRIGLKVSLGGYNADEFEDMADEISIANETDVERRSVDADLWIQATDRVQVHLEATQSRHKSNEFIVTHTPGRIEHDASSIRGRVIADTKFGLIEGEIYHNEAQTSMGLATTGAGALAQIDIDNRVTVAKLSDTFQLGSNHTFRVGGEYRESASVIEPADDFDDLEASTISASGLWDWAINDKLSTSAAVRYDRFEISREGDPPIFNPFFTKEDYDQIREEFSYNLGAVYKATEKDTIRATAARGADLPSFTEFGTHFAFFGPDGLVFPGGGPFHPVNLDNSTFLGNPNVETSIVHNFELGYDRQLESIDGSLRTSAFYQYNDEMQAFGADFDYDVLGFSSPGSFLSNIGDSQAYGFEIGLEGNFKQYWSWFANYSYIDIKDDLRNFGQNPDNLNAFNSPAEFEDSVVNHTINAHLGYDKDKWYFGLFGQYLTSFDDLNNTAESNIFVQSEVNSQLILNANVSYDVSDKVTVSLSGTNIMGHTQQVGAVDNEMQVWGNVAVDF